MATRRSEGQLHEVTYLDCHHYQARRCQSCTLLEQAYHNQLETKSLSVARTLQAIPESTWLPPKASAPQGFRNKAKLAVGESGGATTYGIVDPTGSGVDLQDCPLYEPALLQALPTITAWLADIAVTPYRISARQGELKHVVVTCNPRGQLMLLLVLRSADQIGKIRRGLPQLQQALPSLLCAAANIQPLPAAIPTGPTTYDLHGPDPFPMPLPQVQLFLRADSFFQTNTAIAAALYQQAVDWLTDATPHGPVVDLFCGVGGFALHLAATGSPVLGLEVNHHAIACARLAAAQLPADQRPDFRVVDVLRDDLAELADADVIVVNPPRRGLGPDLTDQLDRSPASHVLYSSCNPTSLQRDLMHLRSFTPTRARLFDMFPQTHHSEVLVLLKKNPATPSA